MELIDVHAHLTDVRFEEDLKQVVERANEAGIKKIVCSAYDLPSSFQSLELTKKFQNVFASVGIHPENVEDKFFEKHFEELKKLCAEPKVVAVGEIGLDYHYTTENKDLQKQVFVSQINLANEKNKPVVVHSRDAIGDTIEILNKFPVKNESLLHCFSGSVESAKILMEQSFCFSFGGVSTFANAKTVVDVIKFLPIEKILLETDCPYLAPVPFRGKRNEPKNVVYIADAVAKIKGLKFEEVCEKTTENAKRLFGI